MENLLKLIKSVESTHLGLGVPEAFNVLSCLGGQSVFNVSTSGKGKSAIIESITPQIEKMKDVNLQAWNAMTYYELLERLGQQFNKTLVWMVDEWSSLSNYHQDLLLLVGSTIITKRHFERMYMVGGSAQLIRVVNCDLIMLIAIQPLKFVRMMQNNDNWNSIASDRFIKLLIVNPLLTDTKKFSPSFELPECAYEKRTFNFKPHPMLVRLFEEHLTQGRAELSSIRYQEAWCKLNNQDDFSNNDAMCFHAMFSPYLELYPLLIYSTDPNREESFHVGAFRILEYMMKHYNDDITVQDIMKAFHMNIEPHSQATIYRHLGVLTSKGIVKNHNPDYSHYTISDSWRSYFDNYKSNWT